MEVLQTASLWLSLLLLVPVILIPLLVLTRKGKHHNRPNLPPTPPKLPIVGNLHQILGECPHRSAWKLSQKHGPVMLLQLGRRPTIIISSAEAAKEVLKTRDHEFCSRPSFVGTKRLTYNFLDVAFGPYGEYWREIRKLFVLELLTVKRVQSYGFVRAEEVAVMIDSLSRSVSTPVDLSQKLISLSAQVVYRVAFGRSYQKREFDNVRFQEILNEGMAMLSIYYASDFFPKGGWIIDRLTGYHRRLEKSFHDLDALYQRIIDEHLDPEGSKSENEDIIDLLLKLEKDRFGAIRLTSDHIKAILMNIFLGGIDTSAVTLIWAMAELIRKPETMKKVQEEIRYHVGKKGKVEEADLDQFQYLKMVVKETLRLHPPGPLLIPRESMQPSKINGYDVETKTWVLINVWAIGRNPEYWEKPDEFFPERFLDSSIDFRGKNFEFLPFGGGRRGCPGSNMGIAMVDLALANLLYCFDWELPRGMKKEDINMDESFGLAVHKKTALHIVPINYNWQSDEKTG